MGFDKVLEPADTDEPPNIASEILHWLNSDPPEPWDQGPILMGFVEHDGHVDRMVHCKLLAIDDGEKGIEEMEDAIKGATQMLERQMRGTHIHVPLVAMALVTEAWVGVRSRRDPGPPAGPGDDPDDEEVRLCHAAVVGGGWSEAIYLRGRNAVVQERNAETTPDEYRLVPRMPTEVQTALHELVTMVNSHLQTGHGHQDT